MCAVSAGKTGQTAEGYPDFMSGVMSGRRIEVLDGKTSNFLALSVFRNREVCSFSRAEQDCRRADIIDC